MLENLILGILPSLIWLSFYLREDKRPEPKWMVFLVFIFGGIATFPAFLVEVGLEKILPKDSEIVGFFLKALTEEFFKFIALPLFLFNRLVLEEPIDGMIYMIISGLGFAAMENIFLALQILSLKSLIEISVLRFWGAIFLHALASGIFGYFVTCYYFWGGRLKDIFLGFFLASSLHFAFNLSMIYLDKTKNPFFFLFALFFLFLSAKIVSNFFKRLRKRKVLNGFFRKIKKKRI